MCLHQKKHKNQIYAAVDKIVVKKKKKNLNFMPERESILIF